MECPICYNPYSQECKALIMPCGHSVCHNCAQNLREGRECPTCKHHIDQEGWDRLPINFALMDVGDPEQISREKARASAKEQFNKLREEEKVLQNDIASCLKRLADLHKEGAAVKEAHPNRLDPQAYVQVITVTLEQTKVLIKTVQERLIQEEGGREYPQVQQEIAHNELIQKKLSLKVELLKTIPPREFPDEPDPILEKVKSLQDTSNQQERQQLSLFTSLQEIDKLAEDLMKAREAVTHSFQEAQMKRIKSHENMESKLHLLIEQQEKAKLEAQSLDIELQKLDEQRHLLILEKAEFQVHLEQEAKSRLLQLSKELLRLQDTSQPLVISSETRTAEITTNLNQYISILKTVIATEQEKVTKVTERIAALQKLVESRSSTDIVDSDIALMQTRKVALAPDLESRTKAKAVVVEEEKQVNRELAIARKQIETIKAQVLKHREEGKKAAAQVNRKTGEIKVLDRKIEALEKDIKENDQPTLEQRLTNTRALCAEAGEGLNTAIRYLTEILSPYLERLETDSRRIQDKRNELETQHTALMERLEDEHRQLTIKLASNPIGLTSSPITMGPILPSNKDKVRLTRLHSEKDELQKECTRLTEAVSMRGRQTRQMKVDLELSKPSLVSSMTWAFLICLSAGFFFFTVLNRT